MAKKSKVEELRTSGKKKKSKKPPRSLKSASLEDPEIKEINLGIKDFKPPPGKKKKKKLYHIVWCNKSLFFESLSQIWGRLFFI